MSSIENTQQTKQNLDLIRKCCADKATDAEFQQFMYLCNTYGLDPMTKEIYFIKYNSGGTPTIITSRDGYLKIANQHPAFDGIESDVVYKTDTLIKRDNGSLHITYGLDHMAFAKGEDSKGLTGAFCSVFRKDRSIAMSVFVSARDYYKKDNKIWNQYPHAMILKVAEAQALKRAFSISGLVTKEEVDHGEDSSAE